MTILLFCNCNVFCISNTFAEEQRYLFVVIVPAGKNSAVKFFIKQSSQSVIAEIARQEEGIVCFLRKSRLTKQLYFEFAASPESSTEKKNRSLKKGKITPGEAFRSCLAGRQIANNKSSWDVKFHGLVKSRRILKHIQP